MSYIEFKDVQRLYHVGNTTIAANNGVNFQIEQGEFAIILGPSGSGKSTALNMLGGMDKPTSGQILVDGIDIAAFTQKQLTQYRRDDVGFVFQFYNLVPNLTAQENVDLANQIVTDAMDSHEALAAVGLADRQDNFIAQLSGGEQQRVTIARAIAKKPKLLLCDEPTGALDYTTGKLILKALRDICDQTGTTVIVITHNSAIAPMADRVIRIHDAKVQEIITNTTPTDVETIEW
ncbi:MAG: ABC transporter ATP-binding protein [Lactobacillaceae bacterium]|jgi:putative ABC transport system ATP-binding protein|nr:ABC transporter ATP-binding protein [Lactobacillaceae bacterium]